MGESSSNSNNERPLANEIQVCPTCTLPPHSCGSSRIFTLQMEGRCHVESVEESIKNSKSHWSEVREFDCGDEVAEVSNVEFFRTLQKHPKWGTFFMKFGPGEGSNGVMVMGEKFAEGGQAELYEVQIEWLSEFLREQEFKEGIEWVLKVFKKGTSLRQLQRQWPQEVLNFIVDMQHREKLAAIKMRSDIFGGTLLEDGRFAFLMAKEQGDLRSFIDHRCLGQINVGPLSRREMMEAMYEVALGMNELHDQGIVHRDLKASNVLISKTKCFYVADYECSVGVVGTGFFRAPEILQACKDQTVSSRTEVFTKAADVYSYGMVCYEIWTGKLPFEGHRLNDYDVVIKGARPELPQYVDGWICKLLNRCWHSNPASRPSFKEILKELVANSFVCLMRSLDIRLNHLRWRIGADSNGSWMISKRWKLFMLKLEWYLRVRLYKIGLQSIN